jgi:hypothetical protein
VSWIVVNIHWTMILSGVLTMTMVHPALAPEAALRSGRAPEVLPALLATGATGRTVWALYGVLPLVFIPAGVLGVTGMWRNVTPAVDVVAAANNYLLPAWMIGFGVWLVIASRTERLTPAHV